MSVETTDAQTDTLAQDLADRLTAEPVEVLTADGNVSTRPVTVLVDLVRKIAAGAANVAREAIGAADAAVSTVAGEVLTVRSRVIVDGLPDWGGTSKVYKRAATAIINAVAGATDGDVRTRAAGTLQRAVVRALPEYLVRYVGRELSLTLADEDVRRITRPSYGPESFRSEQDETVRVILTRAMVHWRIADPFHATRAKNYPLCPWATYSDGNGPKDRAPNGNGNGNGTEQEAAASVVDRFAGIAADSNVTPTSRSLAAILSAVHGVILAVLSPETHWGEGRETCESLARETEEAAGILSRLIHAGSRAELSVEDRAALERIIPSAPADTVAAIQEATAEQQEQQEGPAQEQEQKPERKQRRKPQRKQQQRKRAAAAAK